MAAPADAITARVIRAYCITHKVGFDAPSSKPILCASGGHALAKNFPDSSSWEYCCDCQHCWLVDTAKKEAASKECPACERNVVRRYVCGDCNVISVESDEPGRRKVFAITNGIPTPTCPGCLQEPSHSVIDHDCRDYGASFVTSFSTCPFCDEVLERLPDFPCTVSECLTSLKTTTKLKLDSAGNQLTASADGDYVLLPGVPGLNLSFAIPKARKLKSKRQYYDTYYELFNCDNPSAGEIIVIRPASVDRTEAGWVVKEAGAIEIKLAGPQRITQELIVCPNCGTAGKPTEQFCGRCGLAFGASGAADYESVTLPVELTAPENLPVPGSTPAGSFVGDVENVTASPIDTTSWSASPSTSRIPSPLSTAVKVLMAGIGLVFLLVVIIAVSLNTVGSNSVEKQLDDAIARGNLFPPASQNAYQLYNQLKANGANDETLRKYRERLVPLLTRQATQLTQNLLQPGYEEAPASEWQIATRAMSWATELKPGDSLISAKSAYCQGRVAYLANQNQAAIEHWVKAAQLDPSWALPANSAGLVYASLKNYSTARTLYSDAVRRNPNWANPYNNLGTSYYMERNYSEAKVFYKKAVQLAPDWARPHAWLGDIAMIEKDFETAITEYQWVLSPQAVGTANMNLEKIKEKLNEAQQLSAGSEYE
ncbi:MAG TPA: tetratricopeptide repeat protein [Pyrinomonadaceae bacterium]|nr:tetratricopeptide repeat protein [Pyrinomonadaceae bacterium]